MRAGAAAQWGGRRVGVPRSSAQPGAEPKCAPATGTTLSTGPAHLPAHLTPHQSTPPTSPWPAPSSARPSLLVPPSHTLDHPHPILTPPTSPSHSTPSRPHSPQSPCPPHPSRGPPTPSPPSPWPGHAHPPTFRLCPDPGHTHPIITLSLSPWTPSPSKPAPHHTSQSVVHWSHPANPCFNHALKDHHPSTPTDHAPAAPSGLSWACCEQRVSRTVECTVPFVGVPAGGRVVPCLPLVGQGPQGPGERRRKY